jgi:hypothetical protein
MYALLRYMSCCGLGGRYLVMRGCDWWPHFGVAVPVPQQIEGHPAPPRLDSQTGTPIVQYKSSTPTVDTTSQTLLTQQDFVAFWITCSKKATKLPVKSAGFLYGQLPERSSTSGAAILTTGQSDAAIDRKLAGFFLLNKPTWRSPWYLRLDKFMDHTSSDTFSSGSRLLFSKSWYLVEEY